MRIARLKAQRKLNAALSGAVVAFVLKDLGFLLNAHNALVKLTALRISRHLM